MTRPNPGGLPLQELSPSDFSKFRRDLPEAVQQSLSKDLRGFQDTMLFLFHSLRRLSVDDPMHYQARGQAIGHIEAAWLRQEISDEACDTLIAYASGSPT